MSLIPFDIGYKINVFRSKKQQEKQKFNHFVKISVNIWLINIKALPLQSLSIKSNIRQYI